ncbi:MAG: V-type ATPase subunit [Spirochaetales bacterium]|nr:V-type ATPase subunit [Spirochaetales bacterium]
MSSQLKAYGFINAKIRSRLGRLLSEDTLNNLLKCGTIEEVITSLKATVYASYLDLYASTGDIRAVEFALYAHEIETVFNILKYMTGSSADFVQALILRYEVDMVKNALRIWFDINIRKHQSGDSNIYLYHEKLINPVNLDGIINARSSGDLLEAFENTPYLETVRRNLEIINAGKQMFALELELDGLYYENLSGKMKNLVPMDRRIAERIISVEVDLQNIDRIVRFVSFYDSNTRSLYEAFLTGGTISESVLREAYKQTEAEEAMRILLSGSYTKYRGFAGEHHSSPYVRLNLVEGLLRQIQVDEAGGLLHGYPFTIGTVIAYVFLKRKEIRMLIKIINAKFYRMTEDKIRETL